MRDRFLAWAVPRARSLITLVVLTLMLVLGAAWGYHAVTAPLPGKVQAALCTMQPVAAGDEVYAADVAVSVYNASTRSGLADRTLALFTDRGFAAGSVGNAPRDTKVDTVQIWTNRPTSPDVLLVARQFGKKTKVITRDPMSEGVDVVVGSGFKALAKAPTKIKAKESAMICRPPES